MCPDDGSRLEPTQSTSALGSAQTMASDAGDRIATKKEIGTAPTVATPNPMGGASAEAAAKPDDDFLANGTVAGEYIITGLIGEGGMGRVYGAIHPVIGKKA